MLRALRTLYEANILSPRGLYRLVASLLSTGVNLATLLHFADQQHHSKHAVTDGTGTVSYGDLFSQVQRLAAFIAQKYSIQRHSSVAVICRNDTNTVRVLLAASLNGADVYLLNIDMGNDKLQQAIEAHSFDLVIYDDETQGRMLQDNTSTRFVGSDLVCRMMEGSEAKPLQRKWFNVAGGKIVVLSGGTGGAFKTAERRPGNPGFIFPFAALLSNAELNKYESVLILTPLYHGFGLAALMMSFALGKEIVLMRRFDAGQAITVIREHNIHVLIVVPLMLQRLLDTDEEWLVKTRCILSGGASLGMSLIERVERVAQGVDNKLFNLYGTSEAGFCIMATPVDLRLHGSTIGRTIPGVMCKVVDDEGRSLPHDTIGKLLVRTKWSSLTISNWVDTGDLAYLDKNGYCFLCGRVDDMIISGGENVYPSSLEDLLSQHPDVKEVAVVGVSDITFGQRLKAWVVADETVDDAELFEWIRSRGARYLMPVAIKRVRELPYTSMGKPDKKRLMDI